MDTTVIQNNAMGNVASTGMDASTKTEQRINVAEQIASKESFQDSLSEIVPTAAKLSAKQKNLDINQSRLQNAKKAEKKDRIAPVGNIKEQADNFKNKDPEKQEIRSELRVDLLILLRQRIKVGDTKEDILQKLSESYPDVSLANEVLEFLLETTQNEPELAKVVEEAKEDFQKLHAREIVAGRNITSQAREAASKGLGTVDSMRDMYREITGNPRDSTTLFEELSTKYAFKDLQKVVNFLLHSLGADMKSKGPSISHGFLHRLLSETRSLQAILGVYRFFRNRMRLVEKMFMHQGLKIPAELSFESISKQFMILASDRSISAAHVFQTANKLGIEKTIPGKIIIFSQMRDAVREVAMSIIFKTWERRDVVYNAVLQALEDLEDQLEELMDKGDEEGIEE